jgi:hypothetical protein
MVKVIICEVLLTSRSFIIRSLAPWKSRMLTVHPWGRRCACGRMSKCDIFLNTLDKRVTLFTASPIWRQLLCLPSSQGPTILYHFVLSVRLWLLPTLHQFAYVRKFQILMFPTLFLSLTVIILGIVRITLQVLVIFDWNNWNNFCSDLSVTFARCHLFPTLLLSPTIIVLGIATLTLHVLVISIYKIELFLFRFVGRYRAAERELPGLDDSGFESPAKTAKRLRLEADLGVCRLPLINELEEGYSTVYLTKPHSLLKSHVMRDEPPVMDCPVAVSRALNISPNFTGGLRDQIERMTSFRLYPAGQPPCIDLESD